MAGAGRCAPLGGGARLEAACGPLRARAFTLAEPPWPNTDNVWLAPASVGGGCALALAVAHGNEKDGGCAVASAAVVGECARELAAPLLAEADVAPALRRALLAGDERVRRLAEVPLRRPRFPTASGRRGHLKGIGASATIALVTAEALWALHLGENDAFVVRGGRARRLVQPHTLANRADYRRGELGRLELAERVVMRLVGDGDVACDVVRASLGPGDRLLFGNSGLCEVVAPGGALGPAGALGPFADGLEAGLRAEARWLPPTAVIVDVGRVRAGA